MVYDYEKDCEEFEKKHPNKKDWKPKWDLPKWLK